MSSTITSTGLGALKLLWCPVLSPTTLFLALLYEKISYSLFTLSISITTHYVSLSISCLRTDKLRWMTMKHTTSSFLILDTWTQNAGIKITLQVTIIQAIKNNVQKERHRSMDYPLSTYLLHQHPVTTIAFFVFVKK